MKKISIELKWGVIFFLAILLWAYFEKMIGLHGERIDRHPVLTNFFAIPAILIYVLALMNKRKAFYQGVMSWTQGFMSGLVIAVVVSLLSPLGQLITHHLISPDYFSNVISYSIEQDKMTQEEAEAFFNLSNYIRQSMIGAIMMGAVTSAIVAVFVKKR